MSSSATSKIHPHILISYSHYEYLLNRIKRLQEQVSGHAGKDFKEDIQQTTLPKPKLHGSGSKDVASAGQEHDTTPMQGVGVPITTPTAKTELYPDSDNIPAVSKPVETPVAIQTPLEDTVSGVPLDNKEILRYIRPRWQSSAKNLLTALQKLPRGEVSWDNKGNLKVCGVSDGKIIFTFI